MLLVEACRQNLLPRVCSRLTEKNRRQIRSGSVFVWTDNETDMKRWTDGKSWSPSRVHGSFLLYQECIPRAHLVKDKMLKSNHEFKQGHRGYYCLLKDGLFKKTISVSVSTGTVFHVISYYDCKAGILPTPSCDPTFRSLNVPPIYPEIESVYSFRRDLKEENCVLPPITNKKEIETLPPLYMVLSDIKNGICR